MKRMCSIGAAVCAATLAALAPGADAQCYVPTSKFCVSTAAQSDAPSGVTDIRIYSSETGSVISTDKNITIPGVTNPTGSNASFVNGFSLSYAFDGDNKTSALYYSNTNDTNATWCVDLEPNEIAVDRVQMRNVTGSSPQYLTMYAENGTMVASAKVAGPENANSAVFTTLLTVSKYCNISTIVKPGTWTNKPVSQRSQTAAPIPENKVALVVAIFKIQVTVGEWASVELIRAKDGVNLLEGVVFSTASEATERGAAALVNEDEDEADTFDADAAAVAKKNAAAGIQRAPEVKSVRRGMNAKAAATATFTEDLGADVGVSSLTVFGTGAKEVKLENEAGNNVFTAEGDNLTAGAAFTLDANPTTAPTVAPTAAPGTTAAPGGGAAGAYGGAVASVAAIALALLASVV